MLQDNFDANARNMELIQELMEIVGVADCEELPNKIRELASRSPTLRAPVHNEQKCPACYGNGFIGYQGYSLTCQICHGTGISNRSVGG